MAISEKDQHAFLDLAKTRQLQKVVAAVKENPAIVNVQPAGRWSALHQAAEHGDQEVVNFLLTHGANLEAKTRDGKTPEDVAKGNVKHLLKPPPPKRKAEPSADTTPAKRQGIVEDSGSSTAKPTGTVTATVYTVGGNAAWGPKPVQRSMKVAELAALLDRPANSPGLQLIYGESILAMDVDLSCLSDPADLRVKFDPPKPFDHSFAKELVDITDEGYLFAGDVVATNEFKVPEAVVVRAELQEASYETTTFKVKLQVKADSPIIVERSDDQAKLRIIGTTIHEMPLGGGEEDEEKNTSMQVQVLEQQGTTLVVEGLMKMYHEDAPYDLQIIDGPVKQLFEKHLAKPVREGVTFETGVVSEDLVKRLDSGIAELKASTKADYHPGTNNVVRDIVHPSLYPYVEGKSHTSDLSDVNAKADGRSKDVWGRPYETSIYQWLPSEVSVAADGKCTFTTYINNIDKEKHGSLYSALEELLRHSLPLLEQSWVHGSSVSAPEEDEDMDDSDASAGDPEALEERSLRGRTIQIITKIVDYEVPPLGTHEGVWHVEGMSHENIVATAELILKKDDALVGGGLQFKRAFTASEGGCMIMGFPQSRPQSVDDLVEKGVAPLGHLPLPCGRLASWPNSHIHRVTPLKNTANETATRRIVVFWLVNPDVRIVSTKHVEPQQGQMSWEDAQKYRLALMEERKHHKQNWNLREVTLCEH